MNQTARNISPKAVNRIFSGNTKRKENLHTSMEIKKSDLVETNDLNKSVKKVSGPLAVESLMTGNLQEILSVLSKIFKKQSISSKNVIFVPNLI